MKTEPFIDSAGMPHERERAAYRVAVIGEDGQVALGFIPTSGDRLTCLEYVRVFTIPLKAGTPRSVAREIGEALSAHMAGLDAVYDNPDTPEPPTYPHLVALDAA